jgi:hypothetical protein
MEQEGSNSTDDEDGNQNSSHSTEGGGQPDKEGRQQEGQPGGLMILSIMMVAL